MEPDSIDELLAQWRQGMPEVATPSLEITKRVAALWQQLSAVTENALSAFDLTKAEFDVLATLRRQGHPHQLRPSELTRLLMLTSGGTTNVLNRLAAARHIERIPDPEDRRSSWVRLTPDGVQLAEKAVLATGEAQADLLAPLTNSQTRRLIQQLKSTLAAITERRRS